MTSTGFTLPVAWRDEPAGPDGPDGPAGPAGPAEVDLGPLVPGLDALAAACGVSRAEVLVAAHLAVLGMLGPEAGACTLVETAAGGGPGVALPVTGRRPASWRSLVSGVAAALSSAPAAAHPLGDVSFHAAGTGPAALPPGRAGEAGLRVLAGDTCLRLDAVPGAPAGPGALARLAGMYRAVLEAMSGDPDGDARPARLAPGERERLLLTWGTGPATAPWELDGPAADGLLDLFRRHVVATPDAVAVRTADGDLTYADVEELSNRLAHHLVGLGVEAETLVGVCLRRGPDLVPALLAIWKAGAAFLPLEGQQPPERLAGILSAARCPLVVTTAAYLPLLAGVHEGQFVLLDADRDVLDAEPGTPVDGAPGGPVPGHRLAYVMHTSGSTGRPKGVMVEHRGFVNYLRWTVGAYASYRPGGAPVFSSLAFDLGLPDLFTPLLTGQPVHLLPEPLDVADLGRSLADGGPYSFVKLTPGHLDLLTHQLTPAEVRDLAGVVIAAGDNFPRSLVARWLRMAGPGGTRLASEYGPTEITVGNSGEPLPHEPRTDLAPLGPPLPRTTMYVLTDDLEPLPVGVPGEIYIGGTGVARGYLNRPGLTAERFLPDPYGPPGARFYRTGDLARWLPDGTLEFLGRGDDQVKIRGFRIELGEIRAVLRRDPGVLDAVVVAVRWPTENLELAAFLVPAPPGGPDGAPGEGGAPGGGGAPGDGALLDAARERLRRALPDYMVPRTLRLVDRIPLTPNGKADSRALRGLL